MKTKNEQSWKLFSGDSDKPIPPPNELSYELAGMIPLDPALSKSTVEGVLEEAGVQKLLRQKGEISLFAESDYSFNSEVGEVLRDAAQKLNERSQIRELMAAYIDDYVKPIDKANDYPGRMDVSKDTYRDYLGFLPGGFRGSDFPDFWACLGEWSDAVSRDGLPDIEVPYSPYEGAQKDFELIVASMLNETWAREPEKVIEGAAYLEDVVKNQEAFLAADLVKNVNRSQRDEPVMLQSRSRGGR